jgi:hypothetical protein
VVSLGVISNLILGGVTSWFPRYLSQEPSCASRLCWRYEWCHKLKDSMGLGPALECQYCLHRLPFLSEDTYTRFWRQLHQYRAFLPLQKQFVAIVSLISISLPIFDVKQERLIRNRQISRLLCRNRSKDILPNDRGHRKETKGFHSGYEATIAS